MTGDRVRTRRWFRPVLMVTVCVALGWYIGSRSGQTPDAETSAPGESSFTVYRNIGAQIVRLDPEVNSITVDHEEIPGFMRAMVMDLKVDSSVKLASFKPGDAIRFDLARVNGVYQIVYIRPASPNEETVDSTAAAVPAEPPLERGDLVPDIELINAKGEPFRLRAMAPRRKVITFFYARCPLKDFCPAQAERLAELQKFLASSGSDVHLLSLTLDGEHDGPDILSGYAERFGADPARWTLAGSKHPEQIRSFADRAGGEVRKHADGKSIDHALIAVRVDGDRIVDRVYGLAAIEKLLRQM